MNNKHEQPKRINPGMAKAMFTLKMGLLIFF